MDDDSLGPPHCEWCLTTLVLDGSDERPFWRCDGCNIVRIG